MASGVLYCVRKIVGERNNKTFGGFERDPRDVWSLVRFRLSLGFGDEGFL